MRLSVKKGAWSSPAAEENAGSKQQTSYSAWGPGPRFRGMSTITPQQSTEGTLIVNLYDAKAKQIVWRGIAQGTLSDNGDKNQNLVTKR